MNQDKPAQEESNEPVIIHEKISKKNGEVIMKKYLKGKVLGKGGFATCYEVTDMEKNRILAAKIVSKASLTKKRALEKLLAEIKIHKSLQHEYIVHFEHVFEDKENVYILLEICPNQTLKELLKKQKRFTEPECATFMVQTILAIKYLHSKKIIHRDLKLGNLLIGKMNEIKVADFGLAAKIEQDGERRRTICGTPNYIAPEVLDKKLGHSYEVDVWSIGVICYTLLIGRPPFETNDTKTTYRKILKANYAFPSNVIISENAKDLIKKILILDPAKRPTLDEVLEHPFIKQNSVKTPSSTGANSLLNLKNSNVNIQPSNTFNNQGFIQSMAITGNEKNFASPEKEVDGDIYQTSLKNDGVKNNRMKSQEPRHEQIAGLLSGSPRTIGGIHEKPESQNKPDYDVYVTKWVDYSTKYGLGYLLADGTSGLVFKDLTRITLSPDELKFEYMKRRPEQNKEVLITCNTSNYPKELQKKVLLLNYFKNYLEGTKIEFEDRVKNEQNEANPKIKQMPLVYVKKWLKTKYAVLFRLSNRIVQVDFMDKTRIILSPTHQLVCYKNKKGDHSQHNLGTALEEEYPEMVKRLKYTKEILAYFKTVGHNKDGEMNGNHKGENNHGKVDLEEVEFKVDTMNTPLTLKDAIAGPGGFGDGGNVMMDY
jgi:polo-like kinase 1